MRQVHPPKPLVKPIVWLVFGLAALPLAVALTTGMAQGQNADAPSGPLLTFGTNLRLTASDNAGLEPVSAGTTITASNSLAFGLRDETAVTVLALDITTTSRLTDGPGTDGIDSNFLADPRIKLAYTRLGATARLDLVADLRRSDIAFLRPLTDFGGPDGTVTLPIDFADLTGSGIRESLDFDAQLSLRDDAPFGLVLAAGINDLRYENTSDPELIDASRVYLSATARLDINDVTQANAGLRLSRYTDAVETNDTLGLTAGLTIARPDGDLRFNLGLDDITDGGRLSLGAGRDFERPLGAYGFDLGVTRDADGDVNLTGALNLRRDFVQGTATASLTQSISSGGTDDEALQTALSLGYSTELTPLTSLSLTAGYGRSEDTGTGDTVTSASLGATLGYALTEDWSLDLGVSYQMRDEDGVGLAQENSVFVGLSRSFELPL